MYSGSPYACAFKNAKFPIAYNLLKNNAKHPVYATILPARGAGPEFN
jgi:hypothetical protein